MTDAYGTPAPPADNRQRNMIIGVVVGLLVLCCLCTTLAGGWWLWNNGDVLIDALEEMGAIAPAIAAL